MTRNIVLFIAGFILMLIGLWLLVGFQGAAFLMLIVGMGSMGAAMTGVFR